MAEWECAMEVMVGKEEKMFENKTEEQAKKKY